MSCTLSFSIVVVIVSITMALTYRLLKLQKHNMERVKDFLYIKHENGDETPLIIGHRAGQYEAPENTLIAIKTAYRNGATAVEVDLAFTEDGYGVIIHDDTVDRTTNGTGEVSRLRFHELRRLNAAAKMKTLRLTQNQTEDVRFEQTPTLREVVLFCKDLGMKIILDAKSDAVATSNALAQLSKEIPNMHKYVLVTSFYPNIVYMVKRKNPELLTALIYRYDFCNLMIDGKPRFTGPMHLLVKLIDVVGDLMVHSWLPDFLGIDAVSMHKDHISLRYLNHWRSRGIELFSWTVNNPLEKEYFLKYFKVPIITDSILNFEKCPEQES